MNGNRLPAEEPHLLRLGDSIQLGVPLLGTKVEFDYILIQRPLHLIKPYLAKGHRVKVLQIPKKYKRKLIAEDVEPSTSKPKLYRCSSAGDSFAKPCPLSPAKPLQLEEPPPSRQVQQEGGPSSPCDLDHLQR